MFVSGGEETLEPPAPAAAERRPGVFVDPQALLSPSIQRAVGEEMIAFELKFLIPETLADQVQRWAATHLQADAFADPLRGGAYQTTTLYLDTPQRDVFHRSAGHRSRKFRLRRYSSEERVYLERKTRRGDRVAKRRSDVALRELAALDREHVAGDWPGDWFHQFIAARRLRPACRITYERTAYVQRGEHTPLRLTLDRRIRGAVTDSWDLTPIDEGHGILPDYVICEFKFRGALPNLFKNVICDLQLESGSVSKYRRMMLATGTLAGEEPTCA
jgi:hypothetical protein